MYFSVTPLMFKLYKKRHLKYKYTLNNIEMRDNPGINEILILFYREFVSVFLLNYKRRQVNIKN